MSHVLLSGSTDRFPGLRTQLTGWGLTVGPFGDRDLADYPHLGECDLVIHIGPECPDPGAMPDGARAAGGAVGSAAPLLVIGGAGSEPGTFLSVPDPGPGGIHLRAALAAGLAHSRSLLEGDGRATRREQLQFLGHELRSPLAALKTALDVLARDEDLDPGSNRMVAIAVRNVDRLAGTVEWSQDLWELADAPPRADLRERSLNDVAQALESAGWTVTLKRDASGAVVTDLDLLTQLVGQLDRVLETVFPGECRQVFLESGEDGESMSLSLLTEAPSHPVAGLQGEGEEGAQQPDSPVDRLVAVMVAPYLRDVLGAFPRERTNASGLRGVGFDLPVPVAVPTP